MDTTELYSNGTSSTLSNEQAAFVGRELRRHLLANATIRRGADKCLEPMDDGSVFGGLIIEYPTPNATLG